MLIKSIQPPLSPSAGNSTLRIIGRGLCAVCTIRIDGVYVASFERLNPNCITIVLGGTEPGNHTLVCVTEEGQEVEAQFVTVADGPELASVSPAVDFYRDPRKPLNYFHKRDFMLHGSGFEQVTGVWQDGTALKYRILDDNRIVAQQRYQKGGCDVRLDEAIGPRSGRCEPGVGEFHDRSGNFLGCEDGSGGKGPAGIHASDFMVTTRDGCSQIKQVLALQRALCPRRQCTTGTIAPIEPAPPCIYKTCGRGQRRSKSS